MDAYGELYRTVLFPAWETIVRGRPTLDRLRALERSQWFGGSEIRATQLADLRALLTHAAANCPHYERTLREAGVSAEDLRSNADLMAVPILSRDVARDSLEAHTS